MERDQASKFINDLLKLMVSRNGSDLFITAEFPPAIKVDGKVTKVSPQPLTGTHTLTLARAVMSDKQVADFERTKECNFAISPAGIGRFRVNAFIQQGKVGMVLRTIPLTLPTIDGLGVPQVLKEVTMTKRGLCILVGATGSGKSTTLAAMVDWRNENSFGHIITVEDPVEFVHPHKNCVVTQREVGLDTDSWEAALKNTLRQAPDVILMGEIRDRETMEHAIAFSETGHLCLATLHANSANQALDRIINFFPEERRTQLLMDLSLNLRALVSQRLIPTQDGLGVPQVLKEVTMTKRGLCILVGATGSGKSTTLAAMVDWRNENSYGHIITIEDPVEFVHPHKNCVVTQREVGLDTDSWEAALKNTLRQAPDVILMGEIRDRETMEHAIAFSETGHLCLATLHANSANQALDRIINSSPKSAAHSC